MATNMNSGAFGGKSGKMKMKMKLKSLRTRDDMSNLEEDHYHTGASASVPFTWESEPGTPNPNFKQNAPFFSSSPNSYNNNNDNNNSHSSSPSQTPLRHIPSSNKPSSRTNFLNSVFRKLSLKSNLQPPSPGGSSSSSSSSSTSSRRERSSRRPGSPRRLSFDSRVDEDEEYQDNVESPVSTLFFGRGVGAHNKGCYPKIVKVFTRGF